MTNNCEFLLLLDGTVEVPEDYARDVGEIKRILECWIMNPEFREAFERSPEEAIHNRGIQRSPEEIIPFVRNKEARELREAEAACKDESYPISVRRYRHFLKEKLTARSHIRENISLSSKNFEIWRKRQINRCVGELGYQKADGIVHSPVAFELTSGCSVGCWFCALSPKKLSDEWPYTQENAALWQDTLHVVRETIGAGSKYGVCYWATEPFDNPDYEKYIKDYTRILGRCPQTTTAASDRDIPRLRRFLEMARELDSDIDRFSILSLEMLKKIHENFTPEELLRVELIPQNRETSSQYRKAYAGRPRTFPLNEMYRNLVQPAHSPSTIACISGFIISMPRRTVSLITPCPSSDDWPLGHWVVAEGKFEDAREIRKLLERMINDHMASGLTVDDYITFRQDLSWEENKSGGYSILSKYLKLDFTPRLFTRRLMELISEGSLSVYDIAKTIERESGADLHDIFLAMNEYFQRGLLNEDPAVRRRIGIVRVGTA